MSVRNLYFHYASAGPSPRRMTIDVADLARVVERERAAGRRAACLSEYLAAPPTDACFTISFDDAHRSVLEHAAPALARLGVPATLFVPTAYVGTSDELLDWDGCARYATSAGGSGRTRRPTRG